MKKILLLGIVATLFTLGASAQDRKPDFKKDRKDADRGQLMERKRQGMDNRTGSLTFGEKAKMRHNAADFQRAKHRAYRDGKLTRHEKHNLHKKKKHNRRDAYRFHHNDRKHGR